MAHLTPLPLSHIPAHISILASLHTSVSNSAAIRSQILASNHDYDYAFIDASTLVSTTHVLAAVFKAVNEWRAGRLRTRNVHSEVVFCLGGNNNIADTLRRFGISDKTTSLLAIKIIDTSQPPSSTSTSASSLQQSQLPPTTESSSSNPSASTAQPSQQQPHQTADEIRAFITTAISGTSVPLTNASIQALSDIALIRKLYKLPATAGNGVNGKKSSKGQGQNGVNVEKDAEAEEKERKELEVQILGIMALKGS